jgi:hypothetical protein
MCGQCTKIVKILPIQHYHPAFTFACLTRPYKKAIGLLKSIEKFRGPPFAVVLTFVHDHLTEVNTFITDMAITPLVLPSSSSAESPSLVTVHPAAVATILDQHLRRPRRQDGQEQDRVLGTLMGSRNEVRL